MPYKQTTKPNGRTLRVFYGEEAHEAYLYKAGMHVDPRTKWLTDENGNFILTQNGAKIPRQ